MMVRRPELVLRNVTLPDGRVADITIQDGLVRHNGAGQACDAVIDCTGYLVLPGATDCHVHMRAGSQSAKEDWESGSKSALAGGVTLVVDQPNTVPPLTTPELFAGRVADARRHSFCHYAVNSAVTTSTDLRQMWCAGAMAFGETFIGPSSYGKAIDVAVLSHALAEISTLGGLLTVHAEKLSRIAQIDLADHDRTRPVQGEADAVRTVEQSNRYGCRIHFCHLSSAAAIDTVQKATIEVAPHHLFLAQESFLNPADTNGKVNPPLRTEQERKKLWKRWGRIDIIASDHAPHTIQEKRAPFSHAPSGIPGVGTMMPLLVAKLLDRTISLASLIRKTSVNPASLLEIQKAGFDNGDRADFALYPKKTVPVRAENLHSRCGWTPYEGMPAAFPVTVIRGGAMVYDRGEFFKGSPRWFAGKGYRNQ